MNIIFFGSSQFGLPALKTILEAGHKIPCAVTQPDRKKGRGLAVAKTVLKDFAQNHNLAIFQPENINTPESINFLKKLEADLFVVIAYGQILSQGILNLPKIMALNAHASLLPLYRGAAPINRTIINNEKQSGVTIMKMAQKLDAGPIILQRKITIDTQDTAITLENKLSLLAAKAVEESLKRIENGNYQLIPQDDKTATFAPKLKKNDGLINWNRSAEEIHNQIKGCLDWPIAFTYYHGKLLKIFQAEITKLPAHQTIKPPGEIIQTSKNSITVKTGKGQLIITELQLEGKRRISAAEFLSGYRSMIGTIFMPFPRTRES